MRNSLPFIAGNWKMHKTIPEAMELAQEIKEKSQNFDQGTLVLIPPFPALSAVHSVIKDSPPRMFFGKKKGLTREKFPQKCCSLLVVNMSSLVILKGEITLGKLMRQLIRN